VLDEMMGATGWHCGYKVVAAKIEINLLDMLPLGLNYGLKGNVTKIERRKVYIEAELFRGEKVFARSSGIFVQLSDEKAKLLDTILKSN
jgi:hypothetical protein